MNHQLEDRLLAHLGEQDVAAAAEGLAKVRQRARRRSVRTRVVVGLCSLAAVVGLGSLVPLAETRGSLVTATEPTATPSTSQLADPVEPTATEVPRPQPVPRGFEVTSDGQGGFVALDVHLSTGLLKFVRSSDGETWFNAEESQLASGFNVERLRFEDGLFVLEMNGEGSNSYPNRRPYLAVSNDLLSWDIIDLGLRADESAGPQSVEYAFAEIAVSGDDLVVVVLEFRNINYDFFDVTQREVCAVVQQSAATTLSLCDGTTVTSPSAFGPEIVQHVLVSRAGAPATALADFATTQLPTWDWSWRPATPLVSETSFHVIDYEANPATLLSPATAASLTELGNPQVIASRSAGGQTLLVVDTDSGSMAVQTSNTGEPVDGDLISRLPERLQERDSTTSYAVDHGPAGWTITVYEQSNDLIELQRNGWYFAGDLGWAGARMQSVDGTDQILFNVPTTGLPPSVRVGLFGGVRYFHPLTDELLLELSRDEATTSAVETLGIDQAVFDRTVNIDGWTLGGHPLHGPLTLTSPAGVTAEYADGFAFDNDDITDGVETDIGSAAFGDFALQRAGVISFYDEDGNEIASIRGRELFSELVAPVLTKTDETGELLLTSLPSGPQRDAIVLHSVDSVDWELIWSSELAERQPSFMSKLVVGDDEILIATTTDLVRVAIDD